MSDLEAAETLADLQSKVEFDILTLSKMSARLKEVGQSRGADVLECMSGDLSELRDALVKCGIWEDEVN